MGRVVGSLRSAELPAEAARGICGSRSEPTTLVVLNFAGWLKFAGYCDDVIREDSGFHRRCGCESPKSFG